LKRCNEGFTLLEVMVAMAILATLSIALFSALQYITRSSSSLTRHSLAVWVADNRMNELRARMRKAQPGIEKERIAFGGFVWLVRIEIEPAPDPRLLKVVISVMDAPSPQYEALFHRAQLLGYMSAAS
jgi:general secretion pathway protein I